MANLTQSVQHEFVCLMQNYVVNLYVISFCIKVSFINEGTLSMVKLNTLEPSI